MKQVPNAATWSGSEDGSYTPSYKAFVIVTLFFVFFCAYLDRQIIGLLIPSLKAGLRLSDTQVSLIQGPAFVVIFVLAGLPIGQRVDHANRRNIIIGGLLIWSLATIASGFASSFAFLFAARMVVGIGEACVAPATVSLVADYFPERQRGRAIGTIQTGSTIGSATSLVVGGILLQAFSAGHGLRFLPGDWNAWQVVFVCVGLPGLVVAALVGCLKEPLRTEISAAVPRGHGFADMIMLVKRHASFLPLFLALFSLIQMVGYAVTSWGPTLLMRTYALSPAKAGAIYGTLVLVCSTAGAASSGFLSDYLAKRRAADGRIFVPLIMLPFAIVAWCAISQTDDLAILVPALGLSSFSITLAAASAYAALQSVMPNEYRGQSVALFLLVTNMVGLGLGPTMVALVSDRIFHDEAMLQTSLVIVALGGAVCALLLGAMLPSRYRAASLSRSSVGAPAGG